MLHRGLQHRDGRRLLAGGGLRLGHLTAQRVSRHVVLPHLLGKTLSLGVGLVQRRLGLVSEKTGELRRDVDSLRADGQSSLFVDLRGWPQGSTQADLDGEVRLDQVYRVQGEGPGCDEPGFDRLLLRASGHEPDWALGVGEEGLVLLRPSEEPLALPYLEEQMPNGSLSLSSEANGQRLELWLTPEHCVDSMSGAVQHLSAELRLNGSVLRGCASYGGARSQ